MNHVSLPSSFTRRAASVVAVLLIAGLSSPASAATFQWATVGNAGNAADTTGFGAVPYAYRIATTEVTNAQYAEFLNAVDPTGTNSLGLYNSNMLGNFGGIAKVSPKADGTSYVAQIGRQNNPVTYVSWYDAARFTNWLHNNQGTGDTESGVYDLSLIDTNPNAITRSTGATYFLPSEDEWYKAAYHDATAGTAGTYFTYATGSNSVPISDQPGDNPAAVNYFSFPSSTNPFTDVGAYTDAESPYGTFDQNGNVWEWNEALIGSSRGVRGGSWAAVETWIQSSGRNSLGPWLEVNNHGFRVASPALAVPEPASAALLALGTLAWLNLRGRRGRGGFGDHP